MTVKEQAGLQAGHHVYPARQPITKEQEFTLTNKELCQPIGKLYLDSLEQRDRSHTDQQGIVSASREALSRQPITKRQEFTLTNKELCQPIGKLYLDSL